MRRMSIAENLPRLRREKRLSQAGLAKLANVSQQLISRLESGTDQTSKKLPDLAKALGVSVYTIDEAYSPEETDPPIRTEAEIRAFVKRIENLPSEKIEPIVAIITGMIRSSDGSQEQTDSRDRFEPASPRRELEPSGSKSRPPSS